MGYDDVVRDLAIVILTQIGHASGEMSLVKLPNQTAETNLSFGIHFYFLGDTNENNNNHDIDGTNDVPFNCARARVFKCYHGSSSASIFIDGELVGRDFIRKYPVMEGQHYVRVEYNGQLMYAKMVSIQPDKLTTITTENFVDIRTTTATRGLLIVNLCGYVKQRVILG